MAIKCRASSCPLRRSGPHHATVQGEYNTGWIRNLSHL